jgi:hypothetical protein
MSDEAKYLVRKDGYFYRPNAHGYTLHKFDAGRFTKDEAEKHAAVEPWHMSAVHEDDVPDERDPDKFIAGLRAEIETLNQRWEYLCADIGIESQSAQELTHKIWASIAKPAEDLQVAQLEIAQLRAAIAGISDDYMTSEHHHPGYVLIPTAKFEQIRDAAEEPAHDHD